MEQADVEQSEVGNTMKVGYLIPTREAVMEDQPEVLPLLNLACLAETLGYDSVWVGDSLLARPRHDPLTLLSAIAAQTQSVRLGTAVLLPAYRNPVILAQQVATLDQISEGRLILGVGIAGDRPNIRAEFVAAGVPFDGRVGRMQEGLQLCRKLWTGEAIDWNGRWTLEQGTLGPKPFRTGGPPIWGAGSHPNALRRAGQTMEGWLPIWPAEPSGWRDQYDIVLNHASSVNRAPTTGAIYLTTFIHNNEKTASTAIDQFLASYYDVPGPVMRKSQACRGGSLQSIEDWLQEYREAGVEHVVLRFAGEHERHIEQVSSLMEKLV